MLPVVTSLRGAGRGRVAVELNGSPWRVLSAEAVVRAGLVAGMPLDRSLARRLNRELRRTKALSVALGTLRYRDHSRSSLTTRLAERGIAPTESRDALDALERAGLVDDGRTARSRAAALAERHAGDLLIREDLARRGYAPELIDAVLAELEPEPERARRIVATRGTGPSTLRRLAARGFGHDSLESLIAESPGNALG